MNFIFSKGGIIKYVIKKGRLGLIGLRFVLSHKEDMIGLKVIHPFLQCPIVNQQPGCLATYMNRIGFLSRHYHLSCLKGCSSLIFHSISFQSARILVFLNFAAGGLAYLVIFTHLRFLAVFSFEKYKICSLVILLSVIDIFVQLDFFFFNPSHPHPPPFRKNLVKS